MNKINISSVLFCRVAWMEHYRGPTDEILEGGGSYVTENGRGLEEYNFLPHEGCAYGYVKASAQSKVYPDNEERKSLRIEKINTTLNDKDEYVEGITVIFFATRPKPEKGQYIVGWYKNATVYRDSRERTDLPLYELPNKPSMSYLYYFKAKESDTHLVPEEYRNHKIPGGENAPGEANIFYYRHAARDWIKEVLDYTDSVDNQRK